MEANCGDDLYKKQNVMCFSGDAQNTTGAIFVCAKSNTHIRIILSIKFNERDDVKSEASCVSLCAEFSFIILHEKYFSTIAPIVTKN